MTITRGQVLSTLQAVVDEFGEDYIDPNANRGFGGDCVYVDADQPSCIVGQVMYRLGVPLSEMEVWNDRGSVTTLDHEKRLPLMEYEAYAVLSVAQRVQDNGGTWGEALSKAKFDALSKTMRL